MFSCSIIIGMSDEGIVPGRDCFRHYYYAPCLIFCSVFIFIGNSDERIGLSRGCFRHASNGLLFLMLAIKFLMADSELSVASCLMKALPMMAPSAYLQALENVS